MDLMYVRNFANLFSKEKTTTQHPTLTQKHIASSGYIKYGKWFSLAV